MKTINDHADYAKNVGYADAIIAAQRPESFVQCRWSCSKTIVLVTFQPPRHLPCGHWGIPVHCGMAHAAFRHEIQHGLMTIKAKALERLKAVNR